MSSMNVRASFCVSNVGTIVSSSNEALGLGADVGMSVCASAFCNNAKSSSTIHNPPTFPQIDLIPRNLRKSAQSANKSMPLQKAVNFFGQFSANSFRCRDLVNGCLAEAIYRAEPL